MANVGAGVFQGMPVSTSLSASSLNESAGARTPVASLVTGALVILDAGRAGAAVLRPAEGRAGGGDHRRGGVRDDRRRPSSAASTAWRVRLLDRRRGGHRRALGRRAGRRRGRRRAVAGLAGLRGHQPADAAARPRAGHAGVPRPRRAPGRRDVRRASRSCAWTAACSSRPPRRWRTGSASWPTPHGPALRAVVLDFEGVDFMDSQGSAKLREILEFVESQDATLRLARVKPEVRVMLERDGLLERIGADARARQRPPRRRGPAGRRVPLESGGDAELVLRERAVHELDGGRALPHRRRHALHRAVAHVARGEHVGDAGLERERPALQRPVAGPTSSPVTRKPWESRSSSGGSHSVKGRAPIRTNRASAGTVSSSPVPRRAAPAAPAASRRRRR